MSNEEEIPSGDLPGENEEGIEVPVVWVGVDETTVVMANQFAVNTDEDQRFFLTVGAMAPPIVVGTPEQRREQLLKLSYVPINTLARFALTKRNVQGLISVLTKTLNRIERQGPDS